MKGLRLLLVLAFVMLAVGMAPSQASAIAFTYSSGFQVQNLEAAAANLTIDFYDAAGTLKYTTSTDTTLAPDAANPLAPLPANASRTYFPLPSGVGDNFNGSAVISSNKQVAAVTNVLGNGGTNAASYIGATSGTNTALIPLLQKGNGGTTTWFSVQNIGSADTAVSVAYSDGTTAGPTTLKPGQAATFDQGAETHTAKVFAATVTSTGQPIAAVVIEELVNTTGGIMFAYNSFSQNDTSTNPVMPLVQANNSGNVTGIQIQNAGSTDTTVEVTYNSSIDTTTCKESHAIPAGKSATYMFVAFSNSPLSEGTSTCAKNSKFVGSAQVTGNSATQPLTAIVNQLGRQNGEAYSGFNPAAAKEKVVMPLIMDRNGGYFTGFNVMNVGSGPVDLTCTFTGTSYTVTASGLAVGKAKLDLQGDKIGNKYVGSATCTVPTGGKILAVVNELGAGGGDKLLVYEGITP